MNRITLTHIGVMKDEDPHPIDIPVDQIRAVKPLQSGEGTRVDVGGTSSYTVQETRDEIWTKVDQATDESLDPQRVTLTHWRSDSDDPRPVTFLLRDLRAIHPEGIGTRVQLAGGETIDVKESVGQAWERIDNQTQP